MATLGQITQDTADPFEFLEELRYEAHIYRSDYRFVGANEAPFFTFNSSAMPCAFFYDVTIGIPNFKVVVGDLRIRRSPTSIFVPVFCHVGGGMRKKAAGVLDDTVLGGRCFNLKKDDDLYALFNIYAQYYELWSNL